MRAGKLDRLIVVQRASYAANDVGTPETLWTDHLRLRAEVVAQSAGEFLAAGGDTEKRMAVFRIRWMADLTSEDRVLFRDVAHDITDIVEIERGRVLELRCVTRGRAAA
ncbi:phage head closure protein [uncultured Jannaschia sp.]|uniref:phage head closure protein n=1 Tax=uncultured Jannaschia sp. TaxID=293347 RepID=UPI0026352B01|nr:phage head closure protein [uncultured Jannaschia sp.]